MAQQFEYRLQRIACVSTSAFIWEKELSKNEVKELFYPEQPRRYRKKWCSYMKHVIKTISQDSLPINLYHELLSTLMCMGLRIRGWFEHCRYSGLFGKISSKILFETYVKKIYWTYYGTVDEMKTFKLFWLNNPNVDICHMYSLACYYCLEEKVKYFWGEILRCDQLKHYQNHYSKNNFSSNNDKYFQSLAYWDYINNPSQTNFDQENYDMNMSVEENMLLFCTRQANFIGFKYFWNKLNNENKENNIIKCLKLILNEVATFEFYNPYCYLDGREGWCELILFLFQNFPEIVQYCLSETRCFVWLYIFLEILPWEEVLCSLSRYLLPNEEKQVYMIFFGFLNGFLKKQIEFNLLMKNLELHSEISCLWVNTPLEFKPYIANKIMYLYSFFVWDIPTVASFLDYEHQIKHRGKIISRDHGKFHTLIKNEDVNRIEQFFNLVLVPKNLKENDQGMLRRIYKFLLQNDLDSAVNFLNQNTSDENVKRFLKKELAIEYISYYFIKKSELELTDKLLLWLLESSEKVNDFKRNVVRHDFILHHFIDIWNNSEKNIRLAISESDRFLNWLANFSKEEIPKFKNEIFNFNRCSEALLPKVIFNFFEDFEMLDDFLSWCVMNLSEIKLIKKEIFDCEIL